MRMTDEAMDAILRKYGLDKEPHAMRKLAVIIMGCTINGIAGLDAMKHLRAAADIIEDEYATQCSGDMMEQHINNNTPVGRC